MTFFVTALFNIFMRQTLTDDFWELHKNMNCVFPLKGYSVLKIFKFLSRLFGHVGKTA